jgi:hypothetical protein
LGERVRVRAGVLYDPKAKIISVFSVQLFSFPPRRGDAHWRRWIFWG